MPRSIQTWIVAVMFITAVSGMSVQTADAGPRTEGAIKGAQVGAAVGSLVGGSDGAKKGATAGAVAGNLINK